MNIMANGESEAYRDAERDARQWAEYYKKEILDLSPDFKLPKINDNKRDNLDGLRDFSSLLSDILEDLKEGGDGLELMKNFKNLKKYTWEFWTGDGSHISTIGHCRVVNSPDNIVIVEFFRLNQYEIQCFKERLNKCITFKLRRYEGPVTYTKTIRGTLTKVANKRIEIE